MLDPSDVYRPECPDLSTYASKEVTEFRDFSPNNPLIQRIFKTYTEMHTNQTVDYVKGNRIQSESNQIYTKIENYF